MPTIYTRAFVTRHFTSLVALWTLFGCTASLNASVDDVDDVGADSEIVPGDGGGSSCKLGSEGCPCIAGPVCKTGLICSGDICSKPAKHDAGPAGPVDKFKGLSEVELHALHFGDSGWDCCWTPTCDAVCKGDPPRVPVFDTVGSGTGCAPDIGQCITRPAQDLDGGAP